MLRCTTLEKHRRGMSLKLSMSYMQRFKIGREDKTCHLVLVRALEMFTVLELPICQGISSVRSLLKLETMGKLHVGNIIDGS